MDAWIKGMDISSLIEVENCGGKFFDQGKQDDAILILQRYGMNFARLRIWNDPYSKDGIPYGAGTNDLPRTIQMAQRLKKVGIKWMLDFHYSDFWADPGKQNMPKAWLDKNQDQVTCAVYEYTLFTLRVLAQNNLLPDIVAVGNEISNGLLWPYGKYPNFDGITSFINAGIDAVHTVSPNIATMLHLDNGGNNELYRKWFDQYFESGGKDFEYLGLSYYPFWHGSLDQLRENMHDLALRYQKDLIVAEVSMGHSLEDYASYEKLEPRQRKGMAANRTLATRVPYPMTPLGQCQFMKDFMQLIADVPNNRGKGFVYWEPAWLPVPGCEWANDVALQYTGESGPGGNEWANQTLFDYAGNTLPVLECIKNFSID